MQVRTDVSAWTLLDHNASNILEGTLEKSIEKVTRMRVQVQVRFGTHTILPHRVACADTELVGHCAAIGQLTVTPSDCAISDHLSGLPMDTQHGPKLGQRSVSDTKLVPSVKGYLV